MSYDNNDPRLTAYVLDELENPDDRVAIDDAVKFDPELREAMNDLFNASRAISNALGNEALESDELRAVQTIRIDARANRLGPRKRVWLRRRFIYGSLATAAMLLVCTVFLKGYIDRSGAAWPSPSAHWSPKSHEEAIVVAGAMLEHSEQGEIAAEPPAPEQAGQLATGQIALVPVIDKDNGLGNLVLDRNWSGGKPWSFKAGEGGFGGGGVSGGGGFGGGALPAAEQETNVWTDARYVQMGVDPQSLQGLGYVGGEADVGYSRIPGLKLVTLLYEESPNNSTMRWNQYGYSAESYASIVENSFVQVSQQPLSTFGLDVDTASYANTRRFLNDGQLPPPDAVRVEEFVNAFRYEYPAPTDGRPVAVHGEIAGCPWNAEHRLARIAVKAKDIPFEAQPPLRLTFLIDVSGSMEDNNKLPLLRESIKALVNKLRPTDQIAIVTYRDTAQRVLVPTPCSSADTICGTIDSLNADGSTNGAGGIELAYAAAKEQFLEGGLNRVILATDGDFNVGETENAALVQRIQDHAKSGVFLTVLGFGVDNLKDDRLEGLADKGNGNYYYIDSFAEANRVLVDRMAGTIAVAAKDVKIQVEFNPAKVGAYRLLGYENRALAAQDFNDDKKDAGDLGAGHTVTALYELVPVGVPIGAPGVDALKYQYYDQYVPGPPTNDNPERMTVKLRYKQPNASESDRIELPVTDTGVQFDNAPNDFRFASAAAAFAMLLRNSQFAGSASFEMVQQIAEASAGGATDRTEFISLVVAAKTLRGGH